MGYGKILNKNQFPDVQIGEEYLIENDLPVQGEFIFYKKNKESDWYPGHFYSSDFFQNGWSYNEKKEKIYYSSLNYFCIVNTENKIIEVDYIEKLNNPDDYGFFRKDLHDCVCEIYIPWNIQGNNVFIKKVKTLFENEKNNSSDFQKKTEFIINHEKSWPNPNTPHDPPIVKIITGCMWEKVHRYIKHCCYIIQTEHQTKNIVTMLYKIEIESGGYNES